MSPRTVAVGGILLVPLAAPAAAQALPTIQPLKPCYVTAATPQGPQSEGIDIKATGFVPNSKVDVAIDGVVVAGGDDVQTDASGQLGVIAPLPPVPAPFVPSGSKAFTVTLTQADNPANTVSATAKSTALGVSVKPESAPPSKRIRFKGLGFTQDKAIYAHYLRKGKVRKTVRMARKPGECGSFTAHRRQIPVKRPKTGLWTIYFEQSKRFVNPAKQPVSYVRLDIRVRLDPR
jgi:hypothetical protein